MPIDPSIALGIRMPEFQSPIATLSSLMQVQNQRQIMAQRQLEINKTVKDEQERDLFTQIVTKHRLNSPGGALNWDAVLDEADGVVPEVSIKARTAVAQARKAMADNEKTQLENVNTKLGLGVGILQQITDQSSFDRLMPQLRKVVQNDALVDNLGGTYDEEKIKNARNWATSQKDIVAAQQAALGNIYKAMELAQTAGRDATNKGKIDNEVQASLMKAASTYFSLATNQDQWDTATKGMKAMGLRDENLAQFGGTFSPTAVVRARQLGISREEQAKIDAEIRGQNIQIRGQNLTRQTATERLAFDEKKLKQENLGIDMAGGGADGPPLSAAPTGDDLLKNLTPAIADQVKALAEGRMQFPSGFALRSPYWQRMIQLVGQYDPEFDQINFQSRASTRKAFTSGQEARQIQDINTAIGHMGELSDAIDRLDPTQFPSINRMKNFAYTQTGSNKVTNFKTTVNALSDELTRIYRRAGGSESDIRSWKESFSEIGSADQLHGAVAQAGKLLESKLESLDFQYKQGMGTKAILPITPKAREALDKLENKYRDYGFSNPLKSGDSAATPAEGAQGDVYIGQEPPQFKGRSGTWTSPDGTKYRVTNGKITGRA